VRNINFVQNNSFNVNGGSTLPLVRKPSVLDAGGSSTIFP
jgi:hypothetical protein